MTSTTITHDPALPRPDVLSRDGNEFDLLRFILAFMVVMSHSVGVSGRFIPELAIKDSVFFDNFAGIAVMSFFMLSGFLTYHSYLVDPRWKAFYAKRFFRIFPVYYFLIAAQTIIFALVFDIGFADGALLKYLAANLVFLNFLQPSFVPEIFAFNGALWTLKIEVAYYALVPFIFFALRDIRLLIILIVLSLAWNLFFPVDFISRQLPGKFYLFGIGILIHRYRQELADMPVAPLIIALAVLLGVKYAYQNDEWVRLIDNFIAFLLIPLFMRRFLSFHLKFDISYTLYVVHFPTIVLMTFLLPESMGLLPRFLIVISTSIVVATLVTILIEVPMIDYGRRWLRRVMPRDKASAPQI